MTTNIEKQASLKKQNEPRQKTADLYQVLKVELEDVYNGNTKRIIISRLSVCSCNFIKNNVTCRGCNGRGFLIMAMQIPIGMIQQSLQCNECKGVGHVLREYSKCNLCHDQKVTKETKEIEVKIERGIENGKKYIFTKEGNHLPSFDPGDLIVEVQIELHKYFTREGNDLVYNSNLNLVEAISGFELSIEHLDRRKILIRSKPGEVIQPGMIKTVGHLGMPSYETPYKYGNLHIKFDVILPEKTNNEQIRYIKLAFPKLVPKKNPIKVKEIHIVTEYSDKEGNHFCKVGENKNKV
jgi:DnaJ family protein A protein 2